MTQMCRGRSAHRAPLPQIRLRPRPGVTAAATTAVLARGDGPGVTAAATTAVLATGAPMTPTLPTRAARSGISDSLGDEVAIGLNRGNDGLDGNAPIGDQLSTGVPRRRGERCRPEVLPDE